MAQLRRELAKRGRIKWFSISENPTETGIYLTFSDLGIVAKLYQDGFGWVHTDAKTSHWAFINLPE